MIGIHSSADFLNFHLFASPGVVGSDAFLLPKPAPSPCRHIRHLHPQADAQAPICTPGPYTVDSVWVCASPVPAWCAENCAQQIMHRLPCRICAHQSNAALSSIMFWLMAMRRLPGILSSPRKRWIGLPALPAHSLTASRIVSTSAPHPSPSHTTPCHVPCHSKSCNYVSSSPPLDCG